MLDLSVEATRVALMTQAGCDVQCGLTWSVSREGGAGTLTHHRRDRAEGKSSTNEVMRSVKFEREDRLVAWMKQQHPPEADDASE